jgi:hypothetical protein
MAWMSHQKVGIKKIEEYLSDNQNAPRLERPEVRFLRNYSNYLTPRKGLLGADFWSFLSSYLRNTLLNQGILVLLLLSLLFLPRCILIVLHLFEMLEASLENYSGPLEYFKYAQYFALLLGALFAFVAVIFMALNLRALCPQRNKTYSWFTQQKWIQCLIVVPLELQNEWATCGCAATEQTSWLPGKTGSVCFPVGVFASALPVSSKNRKRFGGLPGLRHRAFARGVLLSLAAPARGPGICPLCRGPLLAGRCQRILHPLSLS